MTPQEMGAIDAAAPEPVEVLIERAGSAVAREALEMLGGSYGRRVSVLAGGGNNGNDGRSAAQILRTRGVRVAVVDASDKTATLPPADLVIDAAYGTGFRGTFEPPELFGRAAVAPVLAVDIPSGIDGLTGVASGNPMPAARTVTFAALKPGLLLGDGPAFSGEVVMVDIGLDTSSVEAHFVEPSDVLSLVPARAPDAHKWKNAVWVIAGSPEMPGAGWLCARSAMRSGSGYVRMSSPGVDHPDGPTEAVGYTLPASGWAAEVINGGVQRFGALVIGPGLDGDPARNLKEFSELRHVDTHCVLDGGALRIATAEDFPRFDRLPVMTPHDGEFAALMGSPAGADRIAAARTAADELGAVVLLKGPTTVVADPDGQVLVSTSGDQRLATAGSGDVLAGMIGAHVGLGAEPLEAAAAAAVLHGLAGRAAGESGIVADDIAEAIPAARSCLLQ